MSDVECPYCGKDNEINHDDGYGYEEGTTYNQECNHCEKIFTYTTMISFDYEPGMAPCLNQESDHDWQPTHTAPKYATKMRCSWCDDRRDPTKAERKKYGIPNWPKD